MGFKVEPWASDLSLSVPQFLHQAMMPPLFWPHRAMTRMRHQWYVPYLGQYPDWHKRSSNAAIIIIITIIIFIIRRRKGTQNRPSGLELQATIISVLPTILAQVVTATKMANTRQARLNAVTSRSRGWMPGTVLSR